ncbi:MAG: PAS domain S-box protein [Lentimicrobium sp.]
MATILLIANINDSLISLKAILRDAFPDTVLLTAQTGPRGIEIAVKENPDVILLDILMPGMDGFEVCRRLKQDERLCDIPVVFLTALKGDRDERIRALDAGAEAFLTKPIDETELKAQIRAMIKIRDANSYKRDEQERLKLLVAERTHELGLSQMSTMALLNDLRNENKSRMETEADLSLSEAQFRSFFEQVADAIFLAEIDSKIIVDVNKAACRLMMMPYHEIIGLHQSRLHPAEEGHESARVFISDAKRARQDIDALPIEKQICRSDGTLIPVEIMASIITYKGKQCLMGIFRDLRERREVEKALHESRERHNMLLNQVDEIIYSLRFSGDPILQTVDFMSKQSELILGYLPEEFTEDPALWYSIIHPDDKKKVKDNTLESFRTKQNLTRIYRVRHKLTGEYLWIEDHPQLLFDDDGNITGVYGSARDIHARKLAEDALHKSRKEFQTYFDSNAVGMTVTAPDKTWLEVNQRFCLMLGYSREEITGKAWDEISHPGELQANLDLFQQALDGRIDSYELEKRFIRKDGSIVYSTLSVVCQRNEDGSPRQFLSSYIDITENKKAQETLQKAENQFRTLIENAPDGIALINRDGRFVFVSPSAMKMFGYEANDPLDLHPNDLTHPEDLPMVLSELTKIISDKTYVTTIQYRFRSKDGHWRWIESTFSNLFDNPDIEAIIINFRDINDRKVSEEAILHERRMLRTLIDNLPDPVYILDREGRKVIANKADVDNIGCVNEAEVIGKNDLELFPGEIGERGHADNMSVIVSGNPIINREENFIDRNGVQRWLLTSKFPLQSLQGECTGIVGIGYDITERKLVLEEIYKSKELYKAFFDDDLTGDFISLADGKLIDCNPAYLRMLGFDAKEQALEVNLFSLFPEHANHSLLIKQVEEHGRLTDFEFELVRMDGSPLYAIANIIGSFSNTGELDSIKGYIIDNTKRKLAEIQLIKLSRAVEQNPASIVITDVRGNIEYVNPRFSQLTGYSPEEVLGHNPRVLKSGHTPNEDYKTLWDTILSGREWQGEFQNRNKNGDIYYESALISPINDEKGNIMNFLAVKEDITGKRLLMEDLIAAKEKAEESDRLKSAFLANMSHEIRTPMNGILGFMGLLQEPNLTGDERDEYIKIVKVSGNRLLSTINDIIDISKIESGQSKIAVTESDINKLMLQLYRFFKPEAEDKGLEFRISELLPDEKSSLMTDGYKLESVLVNLIKNAIKFTRSGSIAYGCRIAGDRILFTVSDTGVGIPPQRIGSIFERFVQAETSLSRPFEGSGLGLSISKAYIEMLGGEIQVKSERGKGSEFSFNISYNPIPAATKEELKEAAEPEKTGLKSERVFLVAEDDDISFLFLKKVMDNKNVRLIRASDGEEAVRRCKEMPEISMVLMDIKMPLLDGYEATRQILGFRPDLPIVALTAYAFPEDNKKAISCGCVGYLSKPLNKEKLWQVIEKHTKM